MEDINLPSLIKLKDKANNNNNLDKINNFDVSLKIPNYTLNYHKELITCYLF